MLQNAYLVAKIGADTAENEQHFAEILPKTGNYLHRRKLEPLPDGEPWPPGRRERNRHWRAAEQSEPPTRMRRDAQGLVFLY